MNKSTTYGKTIAERMHKKRRALGWNQEQFAQHAGMRQGTISRLESGQNANIESAQLVAIATTLHVSVDYLLGLTDEESPYSGVWGEPNLVSFVDANLQRPTQWRTIDANFGYALRIVAGGG